MRDVTLAPGLLSINSHHFNMLIKIKLNQIKSKYPLPTKCIDTQLANSSMIQTLHLHLDSQRIAQIHHP